jgi:poly(3-hydroxybutyrate) depolymerase
MGWQRWKKMTAWHLLAEEKGLIIIYPNSPGYQTWALGERDVQFLYDLIQPVCAEYNIDRSRIYMQGMSNGDQMTLAFSLKHPEILAAAGFATGPTADYLFEDGEKPLGALPVIQMRGEKDVLGGEPGSEPPADIY